MDIEEFRRKLTAIIGAAFAILKALSKDDVEVIYERTAEHIRFEF